PIHLRSPKVESIATYLDLRRDPNAGVNAVNVLTRSLSDARDTAERLRALPEVDHVLTLDSLIPDDQDGKLVQIAKAAAALDSAFKAAKRPSPTDAEKVAALRRGSDALTRAAGTESGPGAAAAKRLSAALARLAAGDEALRARAEFALISPLDTSIKALRLSLKAEPITLETLPRDVAGDWVLPDGRARIEAHPKGDPDDNEILRQFARAVLAIEPRASDGPITILETGNTVVRAFIEAGLFAFVSIALLLWIVLR